MQPVDYKIQTEKYAKCIEGSKRMRWGIDKDFLRDRKFDFSKKFLPDGISKLDKLDFLTADERMIPSQIQGRTHANMFGFVERFIVAKILEISRNHCLGDQIALEALIRFCDEELKHQELFRRIEKMMAEGMPAGYNFPRDPNQVAAAVLEKSTWAVMALILEIEPFTQEHYKQSIEPEEKLSDLYRDIFLFHWKEEAHHAYLDELEWPLEDRKLTPLERERAINEVIELVGAVDGILQAQSQNDVEYFLRVSNKSFGSQEIDRLKAGLLQAYRWQYIFSGVEHPRFTQLLGSMITPSQGERIGAALKPLRR